MRHVPSAAPLPSERRIAATIGTRTHNAHCSDKFVVTRQIVGRAKQMRWKISHHGHDPRQIDLIAVFALLILIVTAYRFFSETPRVPTTTVFIEPSQSVRW
jgi:hypothetical protein